MVLKFFLEFYIKTLYYASYKVVGTQSYAISWFELKYWITNINK